MSRTTALAAIIFMTSVMAIPDRLNAASDEPTHIDPSIPPNGIQMMQILLENVSMPTQGTPCTFGDGKRTLMHELALALGDGLDDRRYRTTIAGRCEAEKFEIDGDAKDVWMCDLIVTKTAKKQLSATKLGIIFGITKDSWKIIPKAFMCM